MYITIKDIDKTNNGLEPSTINLVDALFSTENLDNITPTDVSTTYRTRLLRTKTYLTDHPRADLPTNYYDIINWMSMLMVRIPNPQEHYRTFDIPKKTGGHRTINAPDEELSDVMRQMAKALTSPWDLDIQVHDSAWAYVPGRSVVNAMKEHTDNESRWYLKIDLKDFFGSCSKQIIIDTLSNLFPFAEAIRREDRTMYPNPANYTKNFLTQLADFVTLNGGLPQGTPISPVLTNMIMVGYDYKINRTLRDLVDNDTLPKQKYVYTRYADDIIISAKYKFNIKELKDMLALVLAPFTIKEEKTRFGTNAGRNWNLGIMCNKDNNLTVGYRRKHTIKVTVHNYVNNRIEWELSDLRYLLGELNWVNQVEPDYFNHLMQYFNDKYNMNIWNEIIKDIKHLTN